MTLTLTLRLGDKLEAKSAVADDADDRVGLYILFSTSDDIADSLTSPFSKDSELHKNYKTLMLLAKLCFERLMRHKEAVVFTYRAPRSRNLLLFLNYYKITHTQCIWCGVLANTTIKFYFFII